MILQAQIVRKSTLSSQVVRKSLLTSNIVRKSLLQAEIDMPLLVPAPAFVSAEVGLIDAYTLVITFDLDFNETKIPSVYDLILDMSGAESFGIGSMIVGTTFIIK